jgi:hypothetical protein
MCLHLVCVNYSATDNPCQNVERETKPQGRSNITFTDTVILPGDSGGLEIHGNTEAMLFHRENDLTTALISMLVEKINCP